MDPLSAVGLAAAIIQFIDFTSNLIEAANDIHHSELGTSLHNQNVELVVSEMKTLTLRLDTPRTGELTDDEQALGRLAAECRILSAQILGQLDQTKSKNPRSKRQTVWSAIKCMWNEREVKELAKRLQNCRSQLELQLTYLIRSDTKERLVALEQGIKGDSKRLGILHQHVNQLSQGVMVTAMSPEFRDMLRELLGVATDAAKGEQILGALAFEDMRLRFEDVESAHPLTFDWIFDPNYHDEPTPPDHDGDKTLLNKASSHDNGGKTSSTETGSQPFHKGDDMESEHNEVSFRDNTVHTNGDNTNEHANEDANKDDTNNANVNFVNSNDENDCVVANFRFLGDVEHDYSLRTPFLHWLSSGNGIFHISGKPGSGKSTLMKFLCDHPRTRTELTKWAGTTRQLVFAKFFFWKPGSKLQKSLNGMFRCLLHEALRNCPDLIPEILPDQWDMVSAMSGTQLVFGDLFTRDDDVRQAFHRLIEYGNVHDRHRFCFFIDGLDEFQEARQEDYTSMVDMLHGWTKVAPNAVKICASSREYNVFLNSLSSDKRLCLQDLTSRDIERYIQHMLQVDPHRDLNKVVSELVYAILTKASGIFLWVALVVRSLRERLQETHDLTVLMKEIDSLPDELEGLFQHLLDTLSKQARTTAFKTLAMIQALTSGVPNPVRLSLFAYSFFLEEYMRNSEFALEPTFQPVGGIGMASMTESGKEARRIQALKALAGNTRGLVEVIDHYGDSIKHTHRSIPEFLESKKVKDEMSRLLESEEFDAVNAVSQILVAEIRANTHIEGGLTRHRCSRVLSSVIMMRAYHNADSTSPYRFLESLEDVLAQLEGSDCLEHASGFQWPPVPRNRLMIRILDTPNRAAMATIEDPVSEVNGADDFHVISPFFISAAFGQEEYVAWKLRHDPKALLKNNEFAIAVLAIIVQHRLCTNWADSKRSTQMLEVLLEGGLSPQTVIHANITHSQVWVGGALTFWESYVLLIALELKRQDERNQIERDRGPITVPMIDWAMVGKAFEIFLKYGANPLLSFSAMKNGHIEMKVPTSGNSDGFHGGERPPERTVLAYRNYARYNGGPMDMVHDLFKRPDPVSFRDLVEHLNFGNQEYLLQLIDRNIEQQQQQQQRLEEQEHERGLQGISQERDVVVAGTEVEHEHEDRHVRSGDTQEPCSPSSGSEVATATAGSGPSGSWPWLRRNSATTWLETFLETQGGYFLAFGLGLCAAAVMPRLWATMAKQRFNDR
ncbi:hypothetical protein B0H66DRAFT_563874 [Apodospora peruviana]|uniref:Nephrocystin 3-like N-terminal domain-containing protein n=1 Tax=Apodospora peruviana TaxID=516989 RepID=A0AAE0HZN9_9PEZI|nr:hypothetical protein B0H66DRAFT_563874 [Apodospora peruviana]